MLKARDGDVKPDSLVQQRLSYEVTASNQQNPLAKPHRVGPIAVFAVLSHYLLST